jgi:hypothetical protein
VKNFVIIAHGLDFFFIFCHTELVESKWLKIKGFLVGPEHNEKGQLIKNVFLDAVPVARFNIDDNAERRLTAIDLVERGLCNITTAGEICGFHRNTVSQLIKTKRFLGVEAIVREGRGRKSPIKYIDEIQTHIRGFLDSQPEMCDQDIAEQAGKNLAMDISRSAVARIRIGNNPPGPKLPTQKEIMDMSKVVESIEKEFSAEKQLQFNFERDPELEEKKEELSQSQLPEPKTKREGRFIEALKQGVQSPFSGELMHNLFLQEIGFEELVSRYPVGVGATHQPVDVLGTIFHSINLGYPSIESLKLSNSSDLGALMGQTRAPNKETLRNHLANLGSQGKSAELIEDVARRLLDRCRIDPEVFFIDGHFLPYYGLHVVAKGYYTVRRMAMKGNEIYAVTDLNGRPLFFLTESCEIDFRPMILRSAELLVELGIARPTLVFDRGGHGIHFFKQLNPTADFVTWSKYFHGAKYEGLDEKKDFSACLLIEGKQLLVTEEIRIVRESIQTARKEGRDEPACMELRLVVMRDKKTGKHVGIYTNNMTKPAHDIAWYMCQRWGKSENFFKETMAWFNLDYHPGYDIKELEQQPLVDNPDIPLVRKGIRGLKNDIDNLQVQIDLARYKLTQRKDKRLENKISRLEKEQAEKEAELDLFKAKLMELPDKISILDKLKGRPMSRTDLEKKKLYDLMQCLAFHSRERLVEIFRECYDDPRDIKQILGMITRKSGYLQLIGDTLVVILDRIDNRKHHMAADKFCKLLNQIGICLVGRLDLKLSFHLSKLNHHGQYDPKSCARF